MTLKFKTGDTFDFAGEVRDDVTGLVFPLVGYTISAKVRMTHAWSTALTLSASIVDAALGLIRLQQTAAATAAWPFGPAEIDIRLVSPSGDVTTTITQSLELVPAVSG